tara:strand:- start:3036 stop:3638 length:603 start_codon:yes stop_codon:yes gene_type:complete
MLTKLLSSIFFFYKYIVTPKDYSIISEELEYAIDHDLDYLIEDDFWMDESKDWEDEVLNEYYTNVTGKKFRHTIVPQNVKYTILRIKYYFNGKKYVAISSDINFKPGQGEDSAMHFSIPLSSVWIVDHDDKPVRDITEKVKRYSGPRNDFHGQKVPLEHFLFYNKDTLKDKFPKITLSNTLGMKKTLSTLDDFTTNLQIP